MRLRKRMNGIIIREVGDELLLLDVEADLVHQLNETASSIWRSCDDAASPEAIADLLAARYDVDAEVALKDVRDTVEKLRALKLVLAE